MRLSENPHRRFNPLSGEWVLVSPHRTKRPWQGQVEKAAADALPAYDPACYLCPGNERAGGVRNPAYEGPFVFDNDFAALLPDVPEEGFDEDGLLRARSEKGKCEVLCFSPRHDLTLPRMAKKDVEAVIRLWEERYRDLGSRDGISYVQIFENRGAVMGCSNPHPHGQIWATESLPELPAREDQMQRRRRAEKGSCLLCDYVALELAKGDRIVFRNDSFVALVPFWATWPFEAMVLPVRHAASLSDLTPAEVSDFADALKRMGTRYDNLFQCSFPYSMGLHQKPTKPRPGVAGDGKAMAEAWHFHVHYLPPLLRSATVRKFMVGFELLATPQRDITPEAAAERLRGLSETHYLDA